MLGVDILIRWTLLSRLHRHIKVFYFDKNPLEVSDVRPREEEVLSIVQFTMQLLLFQCWDRRGPPRSRGIMLA